MSEHNKEVWQYEKRFSRTRKISIWVVHTVLSRPGETQRAICECHDEQTARHIVKCVNHFEEMREVVESLAGTDPGLVKNIIHNYQDRARAIISKIEAGE